MLFERAADSGDSSGQKDIPRFRWIGKSEGISMAGVFCNSVLALVGGRASVEGGAIAGPVLRCTRRILSGTKVPSSSVAVHGGGALPVATVPVEGLANGLQHFRVRAFHFARKGTKESFKR